MRYREKAYIELRKWQREMRKQPRIFHRISYSVQKKINSYIPEKIHAGITVTLKQMIRGVLFGAEYISKQKGKSPDLQETEMKVQKLIRYYSHAAAIEGGLTGAGGILLGFVDFPVLLTIKLKLLFDTGTLYGFDMKDYRERVYLLYIFELAFSSRQHRREVFRQIQNWKEKRKRLPEDINQFDWRSLQQEYRDYIDLAKMAQLVPGIGAVVGLVVNFQLLNQLGRTAVNAYRMRLIDVEEF